MDSAELANLTNQNRIVAISDTRYQGSPFAVSQEFPGKTHVMVWPDGDGYGHKCWQ